jgi:hypothetical protein
MSSCSKNLEHFGSADCEKDINYFHKLVYLVLNAAFREIKSLKIIGTFYIQLFLRYDKNAQTLKFHKTQNESFAAQIGRPGRFSACFAAPLGMQKKLEERTRESRHFLLARNSINSAFCLRQSGACKFRVCRF